MYPSVLTALDVDVYQKSVRAQSALPVQIKSASHWRPCSTAAPRSLPHCAVCIFSCTVPLPVLLTQGKHTTIQPWFWPLLSASSPSSPFSSLKPSPFTQRSLARSPFHLWERDGEVIHRVTTMPGFFQIHINCTVGIPTLECDCVKSKLTTSTKYYSPFVLLKDQTIV